MSAAEFAFWKLFRERNGFPADRAEAAAAIAGAAQCRAWGSKVDPKDLLPRFGLRKQNLAVLAAQLAALPGAKVRRIPRPGRKQADPRGDEPAPRTKLLNPKR